MLTTNSVMVDEYLMLQELNASLVYHPFKAQVSRDTVCAVSETLTLARFDGSTYEDVLDDVTQILLTDKDIASAHTGDEAAAIAYGMVQRIHEFTAYPSDESELASTQLIF